MTEIGPRTESNEYEVYQFILGMKGDIVSDWTYDVYGSLGKVELNTDQVGNVSREAWEAADLRPGWRRRAVRRLQSVRRGRDHARVRGVHRRATRAMRETTEQNIFEATATGSLFELPAGKVMAVVGYLYKEDTYEFSPDATLARQLPDGRFDIAGFNAALPIEGETDSNELFTEILIPILADMPGADRLEATLGYRYADYSTVGGVDSYKGELMWRPIAPVSLRGSYQRAVRAPSVSELFSPQVPNFPSYNNPDPCSVTSADRTGANAAAVRALCLAQGIPADADRQLQLQQQPGRRSRGRQPGPDRGNGRHVHRGHHVPVALEQPVAVRVPAVGRLLQHRDRGLRDFGSGPHVHRAVL